MLGSQKLLVCLFALGVASLSLVVAGCETCEDCAQEKCSDLISYCNNADPDCACMASCMLTNGIDSIDGCLDSCSLIERPALFVPVEECVGVACPDDDECSVPSDWEPPTISNPNEPELDDILVGDLADCSFDTGLEFDPSGSILQLQNAEGTVCVRLERLNGGSGSLANTNWIILDASVGPLGGVANVTDPADMCWYSSHHNFADWVHLRTDQRLFGIRLHVDGWGGERTYELHAFESGELDTSSCPPVADGEGALGAMVLYPVNP